MGEIIDVIVIMLLLFAIIFAFILNKKINIIHQSKKELAELFKSFDNTILKAQIGVDEIKIVSNEIRDNLQEKIDDSYNLISNLNKLNERAARNLSILDRANSNLLSGGNEVNEKDTIANKYHDKDRVKALEDLLLQINNSKKTSNKKNNDLLTKQDNNDNKATVPEMLKAMGYGEK